MTFWNDSFVNIPLSYILANVFVKILPMNFLLLLLVFYWLTNGLGLILMYATGKSIVGEKKGLVQSALAILKTIIIYSLILILLERAGLIKPI